ncbi:rubredoxin [Shewanella phaeophyticola]|uniref:Rubredoxin n=1 Tax=Shewanella phaeophyticola TaxID=2978345 RepID=A0ABT2P7I0_9GAMM|nr:rubredoxin [Shewanella sp. KJ10-1]MCT8987620.1 rubredoxin [Shewanella sp. KJ10-1]
MSNNVWQCITCGFIYSENEGLPEEGIPSGTKWLDVPDDWCCPDCGMDKSDFEMLLINE